MNNFLGQVILSNTIEDWLWTAGFILFVIILNKIISHYLAKLLLTHWEFTYRPEYSRRGHSTGFERKP